MSAPVSSSPLFLARFPADLRAVRHNRLKDLRSKNFQGTDEELEQSLTTVLCRFADNTVPAFTSGLEATASIRGSGSEGQQIVITLRKRIDSITVN